MQVNLIREIHTKEKEPINVVKYNSTGNYLLCAGNDRIIRLLNSKSGAYIREYMAHSYEIMDLDIVADSTRFASCGGDRFVHVWDVSTGKVIRKFGSHLARVNTVRYNEDSSILASGSFDSKVRLWDCRSNSSGPVQVLNEAKDSVSTIDIIEDKIIAGSTDGNLRTYDIRNGKIFTDSFTHPITSIWTSKSGAFALVSVLHTSNHLLDLETGDILKSYSGKQNTNYRLRSCLDCMERFVISGSEDGKILLWDMEAGEQLSSIPTPNKSIVSDIVSHPSSDHFAATTTHGDVLVYQYDKT
ncbi:MAPK organizer 1 family WD repeat protein [Schizosaccharomyces cryophilus OY26]|uniref:MAPK organizer 1 family WD repeat protein n=1 Tax=Schizosaccharomyces cryophilus (strain OY26 / ATCC MYA-4695 / CBS 11777 / NBRC 106824 / NRRL Y48691) TaxID=653667 RepID=S9W8Q7_SCHCR|nr:MAPK organizer 1 family WD repeat protein [Schizosaccharomyces cryophilus OY26]EPY54275.1 MAPK organizer 1 family WD repeat protein [Schizosaccharomyces cryophilus OY26]